MYYVYVLHSQADKGLYIGFSEDLTRRMCFHSQGRSASTSHRRPLRLVYYEAYASRSDAVGRERFLKSGAGRRHLDKQLRNYFLESPRR